MVIHHKPIDTHSYIHQSSSHLPHCKKSIPYSQLFQIRRLCSVERDFQQKLHQYSRTPLKEDLQRGSRVSRLDAIQDVNATYQRHKGFPWCLRTILFNNHIKKILPTNFNILINDKTTKDWDFLSDPLSKLLTRPEYSRYIRTQRCKVSLCLQPAHTFVEPQIFCES